MRTYVNAAAPPAAPPVVASEDLELRGRIRAEYVEMPGLNLSLKQAARLFQVDPLRCGRALDALVREGYLAFRGRCYLRAR